MRFEDYTITALGERRSTRRHYSERLVPAAVEFFSLWFDRHLPNDAGEVDFREPVDVEGMRHIELHFTSLARESGTALATFYSRGIPLTTTAMLFGRDRDAERKAIKSVQGLIVNILREAGAIEAGIEPGYDLAALPERPAIATVVLPIPPALGADVEVIADMETCLGAAFFERMAR